MTSISEAEFDHLLRTFEHESLHLETRDAYGTAVELPHMAKWAAGEPDDLQSTGAEDGVWARPRFKVERCT